MEGPLCTFHCPGIEDAAVTYIHCPPFCSWGLGKKKQILLMANCKINSNSGACPSGDDRRSLELSLGQREAEKGF